MNTYSHLKKIAGASLIAAIPALSAFLFLDGPLALYIKKVLMAELPVLSRKFPDVLFGFVFFTSCVAWCAYLYLTHRHVYNKHRRFSHIIAASVPLAFIIKSLLKQLVGRIDARFWVEYPRAKQFRLLHGTGNYASFPSGHMAVFTAFLLALARYYPQYRHFSYGFLVLLAAALVITNYHFLSDVIVGAYIGFLIDFVAENFFFADRKKPLAAVDEKVFRA